MLKIHSFLKNMRNFLKVSNSKEITIKLSTEQLFFIVTCLIKINKT